MQSKQSRDRQGAVPDSTLYANCESALVLLLAVFVKPGADVIRFVSARKAVDYEESIYNDQFR
jgi:uncharacterized DUF497 family protein